MSPKFAQGFSKVSQIIFLRVSLHNYVLLYTFKKLCQLSPEFSQKKELLSYAIKVTWWALSFKSINKKMFGEIESRIRSPIHGSFIVFLDEISLGALKRSRDTTGR